MGIMGSCIPRMDHHYNDFLYHIRFLALKVRICHSMYGRAGSVN